MVNIEEIPQEQPPQQQQQEEEEPQGLSASRLADAAELESLLPHVKRHTLKLQLIQFKTKIEKDAKALQRMEVSKAQAEAQATTETKTAVPPVAAPVKSIPVPASASSTKKFIPINTFSFDAGSYGSKTVSVYISLPGVGSIDKSNITCPFTSSSFDLTIHNLNDKNYRLVKDNLDKEIDPTKSKIVVKSDRIVIKLAKVKGEYGSYDSWTDLTSKKGKTAEKKKKSADPSASIMDLMKDMYDSGDDNMKKMIGETMLKQREGRLNDKDGMDDFKPPGGL